jgi:Lon protease-like protein
MNINLFPLGIVAFPNKSIPLHIFEERYKKIRFTLPLKNQDKFFKEERRVY